MRLHWRALGKWRITAAFRLRLPARSIGLERQGHNYSAKHRKVEAYTKRRGGAGNKERCAVRRRTYSSMYGAATGREMLTGKWLSDGEINNQAISSSDRNGRGHCPGIGSMSESLSVGDSRHSLQVNSEQLASIGVLRNGVACRNLKTGGTLGRKMMLLGELPLKDKVYYRYRAKTLLEWENYANLDPVARKRAGQDGWFGQTWVLLESLVRTLPARLLIRWAAPRSVRGSRKGRVYYRE